MSDPDVRANGLKGDGPNVQPEEGIKITAHSKAADILDAINWWAQEQREREEGNNEGYVLWALLTALRGPDGAGVEDLKHEFTTHLRMYIAPALAREGGADRVWEGGDVEVKSVERLRDEAKRLKASHFHSHVAWALDMLQYTGQTKPRRTYRQDPVY